MLPELQKRTREDPVSRLYMVRALVCVVIVTMIMMMKCLLP
jgi:hypothetical protein